MLLLTLANTTYTTLIRNDLSLKYFDGFFEIIRSSTSLDATPYHNKQKISQLIQVCFNLTFYVDNKREVIVFIFLSYM